MKEEQGLDVALAGARMGDIGKARQALKVSDQVSDAELLDALIAINAGMEMSRAQKQIQALEYFRKSLPVVEKFGDEDARSIVLTFTRFAEGLSALFDGNAHQAAQLLSIESSEMERMSFFIPQFKIMSLSYKATSLIAVAKSHLNAADVHTSEKVLGDVRATHDEMLRLLDPADPTHAMGFAEVYATRLEIVFQFITMIDIPALDLSMWRRRLDMSRDDMEKLQQSLQKAPQGEIHSLMSQLPVTFSAIEKLHQFLEIAIVQRRPFTKEEVTTLVNLDAELLGVRQRLQAIGKRGQGYLYIVDMLRRLQQNTLQIAKAATQDFGRYSGVISLVAFVVIAVVMHFTVRPSEYNGLFYYLGALILALIVGFGVGALRFQPLLKVFSDAIKQGGKDGK